MVSKIMLLVCLAEACEIVLLSSQDSGQLNYWPDKGEEYPVDPKVWIAKLNHIESCHKLQSHRYPADRAACWYACTAAKFPVQMTVYLDFSRAHKHNQFLHALHVLLSLTCLVHT